MGKRIDISGQRFGHLTVIRYLRPDIHRNSIYECQCDCGKVVNKSASELRTGMATSCGCSREEQAMGERVIRREAFKPITEEGKAKFDDWWMFGDSSLAIKRLRTMFR